jgi:hypothetical protein
MAKGSHINLDTAPALSESLSFTLNGRRLDVREITEDVVSELEEFVESSQDQNVGLGPLLNGQLAILTGHPAEIFSDASVRHKTALLSWLMEKIKNPLNRPEKGRKS